MSDIPACPICSMENTYPDGDNYVCADCAHEWPIVAVAAAGDDDAATVKDANGNLLADGDDVVLIKDLKVRGSSQVIKQGTKVRGIRVVGGDHDVEGKVNGSAMMLKSEFLKKV
ncbi:MAG: alkylphosphonate utilization protein [Xanthomonadales bacterium]|uniref:zinc ribbon domain-containing protein YjdM n=1 Tax=Dokdonella sp. TaxID=2291710 RepID=UPI002CA62A22|nr:alkylphosphonate utilization protein [Xanthomonadales bacterium]HQW76587.1 zinc ribbon domain-containing protein YjdM [Dokdonella sp.]MBK7013130.1 alkylphosphonate utilization protein [Xanthomonadales bacterium]MBK7208919.1 alkylphosphonate utilization protein [Xanthomonadales bacterium]MBL0221948.1 alkylphosphonate utilization protein [Xanthomonadales bacterium]